VITVDVVSPVPVSDQLRVQIAGEIRAGHLAAGSRLPSVRQLAADLDVAPEPSRRHS
jgi:GntR family transcriptional regulator